MWDTRREREPDTLTWFPQQFTMLTPSALDIIAAGIQDIATGCLKPSRTQFTIESTDNTTSSGAMQHCNYFQWCSTSRRQ
jgi:hypothetical protein